MSDGGSSPLDMKLEHCDESTELTVGFRDCIDGSQDGSGGGGNLHYLQPQLVDMMSSNPNNNSDITRTNYNRTNSSNLIQDEALIMEIKKFPCLYDRRHSEYKKADACISAWSEVRNECTWVESSTYISSSFLFI